MSEKDTIHGYCIGCQEPKEADSYECPDCGSELAIKPSQIPSQKSRQGITSSTVVELINASDRPFVTTNEIAEGANVTKQTVLNNENEFVNGDIRKSRVDRAYVYYLTDS